MDSIDHAALLVVSNRFLAHAHLRAAEGEEATREDANLAVDARLLIDDLLHFGFVGGPDGRIKRESVKDVRLRVHKELHIFALRGLLPRTVVGTSLRCDERRDHAGLLVGPVHGLWLAIVHLFGCRGRST